MKEIYFCTGDNINFRPKFGDDKLPYQHGVVDQQPLQQQQHEQHGLHAEQNQQHQEEQNNQINQMQVNPPDLNGQVRIFVYLDFIMCWDVNVCELF